MRARDFDYIEDRLLAPASDLLDAIERLKLVGEERNAERLLVALQALGDECREVRVALAGKRGR